MSLTMNAFIKTGTMMQNYTHVLILLLVRLGPRRNSLAYPGEMFC